MRRVIVFLAAVVLALGLAAPAVLAAATHLRPHRHGVDGVQRGRDGAGRRRRRRRLRDRRHRDHPRHGRDRRRPRRLGDPRGCRRPVGGRDRWLGQHRCREHRHRRCPDARCDGHDRPGRARSAAPSRASTTDLVAAGRVLAPAIVLFMLGLALVTIVAGLALAALAARQVRSAETLIDHRARPDLRRRPRRPRRHPGRRDPRDDHRRRRPARAGDPVRRLAGRRRRRLPRRRDLDRRVAARTDEHARATDTTRTWPPSSGCIVLPIISIVPFVGAIASLFGFGAVLLLAWRTFRQPSAPRAVTSPPATQPMGA